VQVSSGSVIVARTALARSGSGRLAGPVEAADGVVGGVVGGVADAVAHAVRLAAVVRRRRPDLIGVYLHGSAALGGFGPGSDVDVLIVVERGDPASQRSLGEAIAAVAGCPGTGLELSVITAATAADLGDCPFEVHVNTTGPDPRVVPGAGADGDPDLVLHAAVCREHAVPVAGPPPGTVFGPVGRDRLLAAMRDELAWASTHAPGRYAEQNAARALRYAQEDRLCSKQDGARWYRDRYGAVPDVAAIREQLV
jgi:streptomycin 3"-adenylyltransferase